MMYLYIEKYRTVQLENGNIRIYIDEAEEIKEKIINEFENLSKQMSFVMPEIEFVNYEYNKNKKLKRVESLVSI